MSVAPGLPRTSAKYGEQLEPASVRVARGAALLDHVSGGTSWASMACLDPRSLNMASSKHCVLCQLFGSYKNGLKVVPKGAWGYRLDAGLYYGFRPHEDSDDTARFNALWVAEIERRRGGCGR